MIGKNVQVRLMRLTSKKVAASKSRAIGAQIMTDTFWCFPYCNYSIRGPKTLF